MSNRKRFCPHGHDKDAPGGSRWNRNKTLKGTQTRDRDCRVCDRKAKKEYQRLMRLALRFLRKEGGIALHNFNTWLTIFYPDVPLVTPKKLPE